MAMRALLLLPAALALVAPPAARRVHRPLRAATLESLEQIPTPAFGSTMGDDVTRLKAQILHYGATLDRGQGYNPTSGDQYKGKMDAAIAKVDELVARSTGAVADPAKLEGRWELVFSSVPHGIFRSSPFFLAIEEAYRRVGTPEKASLFFKLHELQTCSWGASKIGRVSQTVDVANKMLYSEFDTQLFSLTVIPVLGWFKLLPTFGGCVVTASKLDVTDASLELEVDYTTAKPVEGLSGLGDWIWNIKVPVGAAWRLLPWNKGNAPTCSVEIVYLDEDIRVAKDAGGEYFVYARPV